MIEYGYNSSTWDVETEGLRVQGQPQLHGEVKGILGYMR